VICSSCRKKLSTGDYQNLSVFDRDQLRFPPSTRRRLIDSVCDCTICEIAKTSINPQHSSLKKSPGRPSSLPRDSSNTESLKVCAKCFCQIGKGLPHACSKARRFGHLTDLISTQSPDDPEKFSASTLSSKVSYKKRSEVEIPTMRPSATAVSFSINSPTSTRRLSTENISNIQSNLNLSGRETYKLTREVRKSSGRTSVEYRVREKLRIKDHILDQYFECIEMDCYNSKSERVNLPVVICTDIQNLIDDLVERKQIGPNHFAKIGIDNGKGFLKMNLQIIERCSCSYSMASCKCTCVHGIKDIFIVAIGADMSECYANLKYLWHAVGLDRLRTKVMISADMKVINILLGLMSSGSCHPCPWCSVHRKDLENSGEPRTWGNLSTLFWSFYDSNEEKTGAKKYGNAIHPSIVTGSSEQTVLDVIPPPELHLLIGSVAKVFTSLESASPETSAQWLRECHIQKDNYHGGTFNGNNARNLLKNVDKLRSIAPIHILSHVSAFDSLNRVVSACFGKQLNMNFCTHIEQFREDILSLNIGITPKLHCIFHHVPDFCLSRKQGLGTYSEQMSESLHYSFDSFWENYKVKDATNPTFPGRLLSAVRTYNARHL